MQGNLTGIRQSITDFRQRWSQAKLKKSHVFWIAVGAIILTMFLGFTRGGWTTGGTAMKMAETSAQSAVVERLASICVAQFNADGQRAERLEALKEINSYQHAGYVKDQGWATMPGETTSDNHVATECAKRLALIDQ